MGGASGGLRSPDSAGYSSYGGAEAAALAAELRAAGPRVTAPRVAVLAALPAGAHRGVEEIAAVARRRLGGLPAQAVCDIPDVLTRAQFVRRIESARGPGPV